MEQFADKNDIWKNTDEKTFVKFCKNGNVFGVKYLLKNTDVDPTIQDNFPVRIAKLYGHSKIVYVLLEDGRVNPELVY